MKKNIKIKPITAIIILVFFWVLLIGVSSITLTISPTIWQDEVQIVEYGRTSLVNGDKSWGINWKENEEPRISLPFIGTVLHEKLFQLADMEGVRWFSIISALYASFTLLGWLIKRRIIPILALAGSAIFLFDPLIAASYRGARLDTLAMAFMFSAFWFIHIDINASVGKYRLSQINSIVTGLLIGLAGLIWPSVALLIPLLIYEVFAKESTLKTLNGESIKKATINLIVIAIVAMVTILIVVAFYFNDALIGAINDLLNRVTGELNRSSNNTTLLTEITSLIRVFIISPFLPIITFILIIQNNAKWLIFWLMILVAVVVGTDAYTHRAIYLIPYFILGLVQSLNVIYNKNKKYKSEQKWLLLIPLGLLIWSISITLGARTLIASKQYDTRNPKIIENIAKSMIGEGEWKVYIEPWEFYYIGRKLKWKMYKKYGEFSEKNWQKLAKSMDYYILKGNDISIEKKYYLLKNGFIEEKFENVKNKMDQNQFYGNGYNSEYILLINKQKSIKS